MRKVAPGQIAKLAFNLDKAVYFDPETAIAHCMSSAEFDYIIVGGGSAGWRSGGPAERRPEVKVLLVEAGGSDSPSPVPHAGRLCHDDQGDCKLGLVGRFRRNI